MPAFVIAGGALAAAKAAETLRDEGFDGEIVLIGSEPERPYERPPLSKGYLLGQAERDSVYVHPADWYAEHQVDLRSGVTVTAIDRGAATVTTSGPAGTETVSYDKLLLATGASPRRLNFPGSDHDQVLYLRTLADSDRLRAAFQPGTRVVVAGAGWIGLETTAAARQADCQVTVLEPQPTALHDQVGPELGSVFADLHRAHGVEFRFGERAVEFRPGLVITSGRRGTAGRPAGRRHRRGPERRAGRPCRTRGFQRRPDRRGAAHLGCEHLRRRRRRELVQPAARPPGPRRALGQRPERRPGRGQVHARPARRL